MKHLGIRVGVRGCIQVRPVTLARSHGKCLESFFFLFLFKGTVVSNNLRRLSNLGPVRYFPKPYV